MTCHDVPTATKTGRRTNGANRQTADMTVALAGNPNAGKTTLFNALTGLRQHVGNWPGKTVERKEGQCQYNGLTLNLVDLPGTYSLTAFSPEEVIARDFVVEARPEAVVNVLDATNLERNLYLTVQLLELGAPLILAFNMADELKRHGATIDFASLAEALGHAPIVLTTANRGEGLEQLRARIAETRDAACCCEAPQPFKLDYGPQIEAELDRLVAALKTEAIPTEQYPARWLALKLLEGEADMTAWLQRWPGGAKVLEISQNSVTHLQATLGDDPDLLLADRRYGFINGLVRQVTQKQAVDRMLWTRRIDDVLTHKWLGLPIFLGIMYVIFHLVMNVSAPYLDWVDGVINGPLARWIGAGLTWLGMPEWLHSLAIGGVVAGVGSVLVFVPGLLILYFFLSVLEDSGYLARAAFVMDRFMRVVGLHGKSFIPMILGLGCAVPAIYATRTIASRRDRILTALLVPLMSCSARLPVYVVFGLAFFGRQASLVIWGLYALGIVVAILAGLVFTRTLLKPDVTSAFVLELPPYRLPVLKGVLITTWDHTMGFVQKAGTTILTVAIVMWVLLNLPWGVRSPRDSYFGQVSAFVAPVFAPLGFGNWQATGALVSGVVAKEVVVSTMSQVYTDNAAATASDEPAPSIMDDLVGIGTGFADATVEAGRTLLRVIPGVQLSAAEQEPEDTALSAALREHFTPLTAFGLVVFVLLYVPCVATLGAIQHEFGRKWAIFSAVYQASVAWMVAMAIYQGGRLLGWM